MPAPPFNASPYHLSMGRIPTPEDLSRNPNTKALDLLQHHANQYYNSHKIHELSERALKSPTSNVKVSVSSPNVVQPGGGPPMGERGDRPVGLQGPVPGGMSVGGIPSGSHGPPTGPGQPPKNLDKPLVDGPGGKDLNTGNDLKDPAAGPGRSPPPQRLSHHHTHTHHHTHVGLGYPLGYPASYGGKFC